MPLEITNIRVSVPRKLEGEVMQGLNLIGGQITGVAAEGDFRTVITGTIPKKRIGEFKTWFHARSGQQGTFEEDQP